MKKRIAVALVALVMIFGCVVGGTLAWLTDTTNEVKNTFTYGDINIEIDETNAVLNADTNVDEQSFKMVPGNNISKDPYVIVKKDSEACWLFVEIVEGGKVTIGSTTYVFDDFLTYAIADGWTQLSETSDSDGNETIVIYRSVEATKADTDKLYILKDNSVTVKTTVTKQMMEAIKESGMPTLTFKAYAVQSANITDVNDAWAVAKDPTFDIKSNDNPTT